MKRTLTLAALLSLMALSCQSPQQAATALYDIIDADWEWTLENFPTYGTFLGDPRYNDRLMDLTPEAIEARQLYARDMLGRLDKIKADDLDAADRLNYDLFRQQFEEQVQGQIFSDNLMPVNQMRSVQISLASLQMVTPFNNLKDYQNYIKRLSLMPRLIQQTADLMRRGMESGWVMPKVPLRSVPDQIQAQIDGKVVDSPFYRPFKAFPQSIDPQEQQELAATARSIITDELKPAFKALRTFIVQEYLPAARDEVGAWALPDGAAFYAYRVKSMTTTDLTADEIHDIGQGEVARIKVEMMKIVKATGFGADFAAFTHFLRTDKRFYHTSAEALLSGYRDLSKRIDPKLTQLFGKLPRAPYGVEPIPDYEAPASTTAYYRRPAADGSRPGTFFANTYALDQRPTYEMAALTIHEAVPGHHLQISLAQELENMPNFRKYGGYTAFTEGWGLYSESLGEEMGMYTDPYDKFGQLSYEMWRAVRLVVDTGMHHKRWTRQQAIDFFHENTGLSELNIISEVDRYIVWPGQALAYKIGELKIKELRAIATETLGEDFDIRDFHDTVLGQGALPLNLLEAQVLAWMEEVRRR
ncbi:MAG: DUF885 domain-containing protein [Candidatus Marinimicrobia bacterium]|nr:DUF885 domain-containing protein [Candidatus Neomarinimicrobiota bacterium]